MEWFSAVTLDGYRNADNPRSDEGASYVFRDLRSRSRNPPLCHAHGRDELCSEGDPLPQTPSVDPGSSQSLRIPALLELERAPLDEPRSLALSR